MSYKLSYTAQEVDDKLKRIEEGGTGYTEGETIHPIDPKFLPGVCLPVVELETELSKTEVELSENDVAKLEAIDHLSPFVLKGHFGGYYLAVTTHCFDFSAYGVAMVNGVVYLESAGAIMLTKRDGAWRGSTTFAD